ncbi:MAG: flavodoxin family protein [Humidesulfovibrio sp.]|nr:flavodoxin family protein [Humidesulfovibrio sp.]
MPDGTREVAVFACSHRGGGNSDAAAALVARGAREAGATARVIELRRFRVLQCLACRACAAEELSRCVLAGKDETETLFDVLMTAPVVVFASPIYFYALPSLCKTWIDRSQRFWEARRKKDPWVMALKERPAFACFVAGQPAGQKLFDGARMTLKYFLVNFGLTLTEPLGLRGMDAVGDLPSAAEACRAVVELGRVAGQAALGESGA